MNRPILLGALILLGLSISTLPSLYAKKDDSYQELLKAFESCFNYSVEGNTIKTKELFEKVGEGHVEMAHRQLRVYNEFKVLLCENYLKDSRKSAHEIDQAIQTTNSKFHPINKDDIKTLLEIDSTKYKDLSYSEQFALAQHYRVRTNFSEALNVLEEVGNLNISYVRPEHLSEARSLYRFYGMMKIIGSNGNETGTRLGLNMIGIAAVLGDIEATQILGQFDGLDKL